MMIVASQSDRIASAARPLSYRCVRRVFLSFLTVVAFASFNLEDVAWAAEQPKTDGAVEDRVRALIPELEAYIAGGMMEFDVPGLAIGIVAKDRLVYAKGFGVRSKSGGGPVDTRTIFQVCGSMAPEGRRNPRLLLMAQTSLLRGGRSRPSSHSRSFH